jgi:uncharacterized delta-60 repeat protein
VVVRFGFGKRVVVGWAAATGLAVLILSPAAASGGQAGRSVTHPPLAGNLDRSFGNGGVVTRTLGGTAVPTSEGIAVQPDGKLVVVTSGSVVRYLSDGSLDSSFGAGGYVATAFDAAAVALQPDGKIVVAGAMSYRSDGLDGSEFVVARYNPDGSPDPSFGTDGITTTIFPQPSYLANPPVASANALAILRDGEIVAAGSVSWFTSDIVEPSDFALVGYKPDGSLDPTFGDAGIVETGFGVFVQDTLSGIVIEPDGTIVATGTASYNGHGEYVDGIALARYEPDGSLESSTTTPDLSADPKRFYLGGPPVLQHGRILVAGARLPDNACCYPSGRLLVARYDSDFSLDPTFGKHGLAEITGARGPASAVAARQDGKILVAAKGSILRLRPNGRLDPSFGRGGIVSLRNRTSTALALQAGQKILVGEARGQAWTLARLLGGNNCVVPALRGETLSKARKKLKASYCRAGRISGRFSNKVARGHVISTATPPGDRLPEGTKVDLAVSLG